MCVVSGQTRDQCVVEGAKLMANSKITGIPAVDARILEIRDRQLDDVIAPPFPVPHSDPRIRALRRRVGTQLQPMFDKAGPEVEAIKRVLTDYQHDIQSIASSRQRSNTTASVAHGRAAGQPSRPSRPKKPASDYYRVTPVLIQDASLIFSKPVDMLTIAGVERNPNYVVIDYLSTADTSLTYDFVRYYFYWTCALPDNGLPLVGIDISAQGSVSGSLGAIANTDWFVDQGTAWISAGASVKVFLPEANVPVSSPGTLLGAATDEGGLFGGDWNFIQLDTGFDIDPGGLISVRPGDILVIEVEIGFWSHIDNGTVEIADLAANIEPGVLIEIYQLAP
jgi:hypothetical protein